MQENSCIFVSSRGIAKSCKYRDPNLRSSDQEIRYTINDPKKVYSFLHEAPYTVYASTNALREFTTTLLPSLRSKFILVTGDSDLIVPNNCMEYARILLATPHLVAWFAQNCFGGHPKLHQIPIGLDYHTLSVPGGHPWGPSAHPIDQEVMLTGIKQTALPLAARRIKCYGNFHFNWYASDERKEALQTIRSDVIDYQTQALQRIDTWKEMAKYAFIPSPKGAGPDCHRTWEALVLGCIPIVHKSPLDPLFEGLPVWIVDSWSDITPEHMTEQVARFQATSFDYSKLYLKTWIKKLYSI